MKPYQIFNKNTKPKNIKKIYNNYIVNKPSIGIDGIGIKVFENNLDNELEIINRKILNKTYNFSFYKEKLISKGRNKNPRVISIPTIRDKITLKILFDTLTKIYETELFNELIHTKVDRIKSTVLSGKYDSYIKIDIENFYPTIDHKILMKIIHKKTKKTELTNLLIKSMSQTTVNKSDKNMEKYTNNVGVPQGLSISNLLSTIYLIDLDNKYSKETHFEYYRYVDDILILCNKKDVTNIFDMLKTDMSDLKLTIHKLGVSTQKTDYGFIKDGFYFLGYYFSSSIISIRNSSIIKLQNSIIDIFTQYKFSKTKNINLLLWKINLKITGCKFQDKKYGWLYFFSQITDTTIIYKLDVFIKQMCKKFDIDLDDFTVKKFIRTYFEIMKNRTHTNYIPNFSELSKSQKNDILKNTFDIHFTHSKDIDFIFDRIIYKNIKQMEKDIQMY